MFVSTWLVFLTTGLLITIGTIIWAIKTNQFDDQKRASYLPRMGLTQQELAQRPPVKRGATFYLFIVMLLTAPISIGWVLYVMFRLG